jgi:YVTN family beta-propeller protein
VAGSAAVSWTLGSAEGANTLQATAVGLSGSPLVFSATGIGFVWITNFGIEQNSTVPDIVSKISKLTNAVVAAIGLEPTGSTPLGVAVDEGSVWVADDARFTGAYGVSRIDKATNAILATISTSQSTAGVAVDQSFAWVTTGNAFNGASPVLLRIDKSTNAITATIPLPGDHDNYLANDSNFIWIAGTTGVIKVSKSSLMVTKTITVGGGTFGIAVDQAAVWVANPGANTVTRIRKSDDIVTDVIVGFSTPTGIAVDSSSVWVVNANGNSVSRIDKATRTVVANIPVGTNPFGVSLDQHSVWVANYGSNTVSRVDKATNTVVATIGVGKGPTSLGDATGFAFDALFKPVVRAGGP